MSRHLVALVAAILAACTTMPRPDSVRVGDAQDRVRAQLGAPGAERKLATGELAWYYLSGPDGFETWRVVFGPGGAVAEYRQVLTMANFEWMRDGATRERVLDRVGPPMQRMAFKNTATEAWTYRWRDGTLVMNAEPVFDDATGAVKYVGIFRDPAMSSVQGSTR
jgi:outer membrane protein assembly factor BamE (lipoprotein component of BamABCDE complex)